MSYFTLDINKTLNEENDMSQITHDTTKKTNDIQRHTKRHSDETKRKISESQKRRYMIIDQLINNADKQFMTKDSITDIVKKTVEDYMKDNAIQIFPNNNND